VVAAACGLLVGCRLGTGPVEAARDLVGRVHAGQCDKAVALLTSERAALARAEMKRRGVDGCRTGELALLQGRRGLHFALRRQDTQEATVVVKLEHQGNEENWLATVRAEGKTWRVDGMHQE
jgi:hypothetical protein